MTLKNPYVWQHWSEIKLWLKVVPYFYVPKSPSSDEPPAPEIFSFTESVAGHLLRNIFYFLFLPCLECLRTNQQGTTKNKGTEWKAKVEWFWVVCSDQTRRRLHTHIPGRRFTVFNGNLFPLRRMSQVHQRLQSTGLHFFVGFPLNLSVSLSLCLTLIRPVSPTPPPSQHYLTLP